MHAKRNLPIQITSRSYRARFIEAKFPQRQVHKWWELGFMGMWVKPKYNAAEMRYHFLCIGYERLVKNLMLSASVCYVCKQILLYAGA